MPIKIFASVNSPPPFLLRAHTHTRIIFKLLPLLKIKFNVEQNKWQYLNSLLIAFFDHNRMKLNVPEENERKRCSRRLCSIRKFEITSRILMLQQVTHFSRKRITIYLGNYLCYKAHLCNSRVPITQI